MGDEQYINIEDGLSVGSMKTELSVGSIKVVDEELEERVDIIEDKIEGIDAINNKITELEESVDNIENEIEGIDAINNKITELEGSVGVIEGEIEEINSSLDSIPDLTKITELEGRVGVIEGEIEEINSSLGNIPGANLKYYGIFKNGGAISIAKDVDVFVPMTTIITANDMTLDNEGAINIPSDGLYIITASLTWAKNENGFRKVALEHHQKDYTTDRVAIAVSQIRATSNGETSQNVSTHCYCKTGDKIKLSVHQDTRNALNLVEWSNSVVVTISRI